MSEQIELEFVNSIFSTAAINEAFEAKKVALSDVRFVFIEDEANANKVSIKIDDQTFQFDWCYSHKDLTYDLEPMLAQVLKIIKEDYKVREVLPSVTDDVSNLGIF